MEVAKGTITVFPWLLASVSQINIRKLYLMS